MPCQTQPKRSSAEQTSRASQVSSPQTNSVAQEFRNIDFPNEGFPDVLLIAVYLLYGEKVFDFYVKQFLGISHPLFFTHSGKTGLVLRRSDEELTMPPDFPEQVIDYVKTLNARGQPAEPAPED